MEKAITNFSPSFSFLFFHSSFLSLSLPLDIPTSPGSPLVPRIVVACNSISSFRLFVARHEKYRPRIHPWKGKTESFGEEERNHARERPIFLALDTFHAPFYSIFPINSLEGGRAVRRMPACRWKMENSIIRPKFLHPRNSSSF